VRDRGSPARIEVAPPGIPSVERRWDAVEAAFRDLGFSAVELDPRGYRRGSLLGLERTGS
jgi:PP-loop superfamily ATP-utilizing enzyme